MQKDFFLNIPENTTALYPNRIRDKERVERLTQLPEFPEEPVVFHTPVGSLFSNRYLRVVYGDHGPYIEFEPSFVLCELKPRFNRSTPKDAYYEWLKPADGSDIKVYLQQRDVRNLPNPPSGGFRGYREEGYADYTPGMIYVSVWELRITIGE